MWNWNVSKPLDNSPLPGKLDWKRFLGKAKDRDLEPMRFRRWRYFWDYSGGNMTDQGTHLMDVIQWFCNNGKPPSSAVCQGMITVHKGADVPDTFSAVYEYPTFLATWTLASDTRVLRNGAQAANGYGTIIYWYANTIYVFGTDSNWWTWNGSGWTVYGPTKPGTSSSGGSTTAPTVSPDRAMVPTTTNAIVDSSLATWTLAGDTRILRNGVHAANGYGTMIYWYSNTIYVFGTDSRWWTWNGSGWTVYGPSQPGTSSSGGST